MRAIVINPGDVVCVAIGAALRSMRKRAGMLQVEVARATKIHRPIVSRIERGEHCASLETCYRIAAACGGSVLEVTAVIDRMFGLDDPALRGAV